MPSVGQLAIQYAPPPRWHRRRVFRRLALVILLGGCIAAAVRWGPATVRQARLLWAQHQCMAGPLPDQVTDFGRDVTGADEVHAGGASVVRLLPGPSSVGRPVRAWERLKETALPPGSASGAVVLLHEVRNGRGARRLVDVEAGWDDTSLFSRFLLGVRVLRPGTFFSPPKLVREVWFDVPTAERLSTGKVDPADPSRWTIAADVGQVVTWKARLRDDDTIELVTHGGSPPLTPSLPPFTPLTLSPRPSGWINGSPALAPPRAGDLLQSLPSRWGDLIQQ